MREMEAFQGQLMASASKVVVEAAVHQHRSGNLDRAQRMYQQILVGSPQNTTVLHLLGCVHLQRGEHIKAQKFIGQAIKINPSVAAFYNNMGTTLRGLGKLKRALSHYEQAVRLQPEYADAYYNLGTVLLEQRRFKRAVSILNTGVKVQPTHVSMWNNLGRTQHELGKLKEAQQSYREALRLDPKQAEVYGNLGGVLKDRGHLSEAVEAYRQALDINGSLTEVWRSLANALISLERHDEAIECLRSWGQLEPKNGEAHRALGAVLYQAGKLDETIQCYREVVRLEPDSAQAHLVLGDALRDRDLFNQAAIGYREALRIKPKYPEAMNNLGFALMMQGRVEEALTCYRELLKIKPSFSLAQSNLALFSNYDPASTPASVTGEYRRWAKRHARGAKRLRPHTNDSKPDRRLRVGYITPAFRHHPVGYFFDAFLGEHNAKNVEVFCYDDVSKPDDMTQRLRSYTSNWQVVKGLSDKRVEQMIRDDKIDILIYAANHTAGHRLKMAAHKPAPIQVSWLEGPPVTTGISAMDYVISDRYQSPPGDDQHFVESVYHMPDGYVCYRPLEFSPEVNALPALERGHVTFGCFNALCKVNPQVVELWSKLLRRVPSARLMLKTWALKEQSTCDRYNRMFEQHGIDPERVDLCPASPRHELLAHYNQIDMTLDPFPYSGGVTTLESLWMGVPVVTLNPDDFAVRHSVSHLSNVGLTKFIAPTKEAYIDTAVSLAEDLPRLARLRASLRQRMATSPVCDSQKFVKNLEQAYRTMWTQWRENSKPNGPVVRVTGHRL